MVINVIGLLRQSALELRRHDTMRAYGLLELANNLREVMRGDATMEEFKSCYVGQDGEPIDIDEVLPPAA